MKYAGCAETNEKSISRFLDIVVFVRLYLIFFCFCHFSMNFEYKIDHNSENKNRKNLKYDFSYDSALCASFM